jgi:membrane associated rhomboid family serine protease
MNFNFPPFATLPTVIKNYILLLVIVFVANFTLQSFNISVFNLLALHLPMAKPFMAYQYVTYGLLQPGLIGILFTVLALWTLGASIENYMSSRKFFTFILIVAIGAGIIVSVIDYALQQNLATTLNDGQLALLRNMPLHLTCSTVLAGCLMAFGYLFPNNVILLYFIPVKAQYLVYIIIALNIASAINSVINGAKPDFSGLAAMLVAFIVLKIWNEKSNSNISYF